MNAAYPFPAESVPDVTGTDSKAAPATAQEAAFRIGHDILGPVFAAYLDRLDQHIRHFTLDHDASVLFVARAGIRIRTLYRTWLAARGRSEPEGLDFLWTSRLACAKAAWGRDWTELVRLIEREMPGASLGEVIVAVSNGSTIADMPLPDDPSYAASSTEFAHFIWSDDPLACSLRGHLEEQGALFEAMVDAACGDRKRVVLVDSGWQGTVQATLTRAFSDKDWWGLYLGVIPSAVGGPHRQQMVGLIYDGENWDPARPETALILHRHLFESMLEPPVPSINALARGGDGQLLVPQASALLADCPSEDTDPLFCGVLAAVARPATGAGDYRVRLHAEARSAHRELARMLSEPTRDEALVLCPPPRSMDLGREGKIPVVIAPETAPRDQTAEERIAEALWQPGQIALDYTPATAPERLRQWLAQRGGALPRAAAPVPVPTSPAPRAHPRVAVITRTMDRPQMLERALRSVASQSYEDFVHVVVCDGGPIDRLRATIAATPAVAPRLMVIDNVVNRGMEAASNIAIRHCESEFIVIHDDDDSWHPDFLREAVTFLDSKAGQRYGGVVTGTEYVSEEVTHEGIVEHGRRPYNPDLVSLPLVDLARENRFAPIAFLFRRAIYDQLGGFDERFEVLGDWDFNLRFLAHADIAVLPRVLARYHHRDKGVTSVFANSVIGARDKHAEYLAVLRNKYLREQTDPVSATIAAAMVSAPAVPRELTVISSDDGGAVRHWTQLADERWVLLTAMAREIVTLRSQLQDMRDSVRAADERWVAAAMLARELAATREERDRAMADARAARHAADAHWMLAASYAAEAQTARAERDAAEAKLDRLCGALEEIQRQPRQQV